MATDWAATETLSSGGVFIPPRCAERVTSLEFRVQQLQKLCETLGDQVRSKASADAVVCKAALESSESALRASFGQDLASLTARLEHLSSEVRSKADASSVASKEEMSSLAAVLESKASIEEVVSRGADASQKAAEGVLAARTEVESLRRHLHDTVASVGAQFEQIDDLLLLKADGKNTKADLAAVSSALQSVSALVQEKVSTQELAGATAVLATRADFEALQKRVDENSTLRFRLDHLSDQVSQKVDAEVVPSRADLSAVVDTLANKAGLDELMNLGMSVSLKADATAVEAMRRGLDEATACLRARLEQLAAEVHQKAGVDSVPTKSEFTEALGGKATTEDVASLGFALGQKADVESTVAQIVD